MFGSYYHSRQADKNKIMKSPKNNFQSMFQQKIQLDQETKQKLQSFAPQMEEWKNKPVEESEFTRTVVCGEEEFKKPESKKIKK